MVNQWTGEWTYIPNTPDNKKCNLDYVADIVTEKGYIPKNISLEQLCEYILADAEENITTEYNNNNTDARYNKLCKNSNIQKTIEISLEQLCEYILTDDDTKDDNVALYDENGNIIPETLKQWLNENDISEWDYQH